MSILSTEQTRDGCLGQARAAGQGVSTHWGTRRSLNVHGNNCCNGFGMTGHWKGQVPLCLQPHQLSQPSIRWLKTSHRNPVSCNRQTTNNWFIISIPHHHGWDRRGGFFFCYGKRSFSQEILWLCDICVRLLCTAPHGCDRDMACPGHMWLSPLLCQCMTTPGRPLHRELKSNLDK